MTNTAFLPAKWARELDYRQIKELWASCHRLGARCKPAHRVPSRPCRACASGVDKRAIGRLGSGKTNPST
ncbi:DUF1348 family protein [Dyella sp. M7H15-1]|nr:DUF1348 family protein [Dyella sp. M7H15-1]